jgi:hypothetical protein
VRWDEHLGWLTDEQRACIADPDSRFEAEHYKWERSQAAGSRM